MAGGAESSDTTPPATREEDETLLVKEQKTAGRDGWRRRSSYRVLGTAVALLAGVGATLAVLSFWIPALRTTAAAQAKAAVEQSKALQQGWQAAGAAAPPPTSFFMCPGPGQCGMQESRQWVKIPNSLVAEVGDLGTLPGVPPGVADTVLAHWRESPPYFHGRPVGLRDIANFIRDLLPSDPFGTGEAVPYVDFNRPDTPHALYVGAKAVAITQRQLAFIVANVLMGNDLHGGSGLSAAIRRCAAHSAKGYLFSLLSLLAVLSRELRNGSQGSLLVAATPRDLDEGWRGQIERSILTQPKVCMQQDGPYGERCADFMAGSVEGQALTDIAGRSVGGGGGLCEVENSQDESLVIFYSEVLAFAFFVADAKMLPVPWVLLGARRYVNAITGRSEPSGPHINSCGYIHETDWLNQDISNATFTLPVDGVVAQLASHAFVAVASSCWVNEAVCPIIDSINHKCPSQRKHFEQDVALWYQAYSKGMYLPQVQDAFAGLVRRIGTGPWGAGVWFGDSQQYFLTVWLATSLLGGPSLEYYVYDHFCENPGNQCFVLGAEAGACAACVNRSGANDVSASQCGQAGLGNMLARFSGRPVRELFYALKAVGPPPMQVFDHLVMWRPSPEALAQPVAGGKEVFPDGWFAPPPAPVPVQLPPAPVPAQRQPDAGPGGAAAAASDRPQVDFWPSPQGLHGDAKVGAAPAHEDIAVAQMMRQMVQQETPA